MAETKKNSDKPLLEPAAVGAIPIMGSLTPLRCGSCGAQIVCMKDQMGTVIRGCPNCTPAYRAEPAATPGQVEPRFVEPIEYKTWEDAAKAFLREKFLPEIAEKYLADFDVVVAMAFFGERMYDKGFADAAPSATPQVEAPLEYFSPEKLVEMERTHPKDSVVWKLVRQLRAQGKPLVVGTDGRIAGTSIPAPVSHGEPCRTCGSSAGGTCTDCGLIPGANLITSQREQEHAEVMEEVRDNARNYE